MSRGRVTQLRKVHQRALRDRSFEEELIRHPRRVLEPCGVPEAEIRLIEAYAPDNALHFGLVISRIDRLLYAPPQGRDIFFAL